MKENFFYDPDTGAWTWLAKPTARSNRVVVGAEAGCICPASGYRMIGIMGEVYRAPRLAWLYMTGEWPPTTVDHKNTVRDDDRWENLRLASRSEQSCNRRKQSNNKSGYKGVYFDAPANKYRARICVDGIRTDLGHHNTVEAAYHVYSVAALLTTSILRSSSTWPRRFTTSARMP